jgi:phosphate transport system permease protein
MRSHPTYRIFKDRICRGLVCLFCALALLPFFLITCKLFLNGYKQFNGDLFTQISPTPIESVLAQTGGEIIQGGILNGICGSLLIVLIAIILSVPLGIMAGIYIYDNRTHKLTPIICYVSAMLQGIPSIIIGIVIYLWIVKPLHSFSALAGGIALAIVLLPLIVRITLRSLDRLPKNLMESGIALGGSYTCVTLKIVLPAAAKSLLGGILISLSRIVGITAPLIITALGSSMINWEIDQPTSAVCLLVWNFFNNPPMVDLMWSAALVLFLIVVLLNVIAKCISLRNIGL